MKQTDFEIGEELVERGEYDSAFCFFEEIATDPNRIPTIRADAYTWMGTLVRILPSLGDGDECGLSFYKRALELHPDNVWAAKRVESSRHLETTFLTIRMRRLFVSQCAASINGLNGLMTVLEKRLSEFA